MGFVERAQQQQWERALLSERMEKARATYERLSAVGWNDLSKRDRVIIEAFGWLLLEDDNEPETDHEVEEHEVEECET